MITAPRTTAVCRQTAAALETVKVMSIKAARETILSLGSRPWTADSAG